jgi:hypothetical protein
MRNTKKNKSSRPVQVTAPLNVKPTKQAQINHSRLFLTARSSQFIFTYYFKHLNKASSFLEVLLERKENEDLFITANASKIVIDKSRLN